MPNSSMTCPKTPRGVGTSAEAEKKDAVSRTPDTDRRSVAVDDTLGEAASEHLMNAIGYLHRLTRLWRADAVNIKGDLIRWIDRGVGPGPRRAVELVDVGAA